MENLIDKRQITAQVTKISWERIWLHLEVKVTYAGDADRESPLSFYLVNGLFEPKAKLKVEEIEAQEGLEAGKAQDIYRLKVNITNPGTSLCLPHLFHDYLPEEAPDGESGNCRITGKRHQQRFPQFPVWRQGKGIFGDVLCNGRRRRASVYHVCACRRQDRHQRACGSREEGLSPEREPEKEIFQNQ